MALTDYVGRAPSDGAEGTRIDRVTAHHVWDVDHKSTAACANCGTGISLNERHLLVRLVSRSHGHRSSIVNTSVTSAVSESGSKRPSRRGYSTARRCISSTISGFRSVEVSPSGSPSETFSSKRRMIFPDRVFGKSPVSTTRSGRAIGPISSSTA